MTASLAWAAIIAVTVTETLLFGGWALHTKSIIRDILREEKKLLREAAKEEAERRAHQRVREIIGQLRIQIGVQLINDSDVAWSRDDIKHHKQDAA